MARDFRRFRSARPQIGSLETVYRIAKARRWRAFLRLVEVQLGTGGLPGWGGRIRTSAWGNQNPLPYHLATPQQTLWETTGSAPRKFPQATPVYRESRAISTG